MASGTNKTTTVLEQSMSFNFVSCVSFVVYLVISLGFSLVSGCLVSSDDLHCLVGNTDSDDLERSRGVYSLLCPRERWAQKISTSENFSVQDSDSTDTHC